MSHKLIFILVLAGLAIVFILQNIAIVEIQFLFWSIQMSRLLMMFIMLGVGMILGWFLHSYIDHHKGKS